METVFLGCFLFGVIFTVASLLLGGVGHVGHMHFGQGGHHGHAGHLPGHGSHGYPHGSADGQPLFLFGISSLVAALTWFGAAGYLLTRWLSWPPIASGALGIGAGLVAAIVVARFLAMLRAGERVMDPSDYRLVGTVARVTIGIPGDGVGEIVFAKAGARRSEAARTLDGAPIPRDAEVVVTSYERGVATVQRWDEFYAGKEKN